MEYLKIWGCVGGVANHRGGTPCVEIRLDQTSYILDAGSGFVPCIREVQNLGGVFFSHFHLDHVQGLWVSDLILNAKKWGRVNFVAGKPEGFTLDEALSSLMRKPTVPAGLGWELYKETHHPLLHTLDNGVEASFGEGSSGIKVRMANVVHGRTESCSSRITLPSGKVVVYATDVDAGASHDTLVDLARGADVLVIDTQQTNAEYDGMGSPRAHSSPATVTSVVNEAGVKQLITFHHGDYNSPERIEEIRQEAQALTQASVISACDDMVFAL